MFRKVVNMFRYTVEGWLVVWGREEVDVKMAMINGLRLKYGLKPWDLSERSDG